MSLKVPRKMKAQRNHLKDFTLSLLRLPQVCKYVINVAMRFTIFS